MGERERGPRPGPLSERSERLLPAPAGCSPGTLVSSHVPDVHGQCVGEPEWARGWVALRWKGVLPGEGGIPPFAPSCREKLRTGIRELENRGLTYIFPPSFLDVHIGHLDFDVHD